jgi:arylsulfatase A-like enzyme
MVATPQNLLVIMSDKRNRKITGYAEHPIVSTLALDTLAAPGTGFTAAYTPSPICVPARASFGRQLRWCAGPYQSPTPRELQKTAAQ